MAEELTTKNVTHNKIFWYGAGAIVAILGYLWWKNRQAQTASLNASNATLPLTEPFGAMGATTNLAPSAPSAPSSGVIGTFTDWSNQVQTWASKTLGKDAADVQNALQAYNNMECLSPNQYSIIDQALAQFGAPPNAPFTGLVMCPQSAPTPSVADTVTNVVNGILAANGPLAGKTLSPISAQAAVNESKAGNPVYVLGANNIAWDQKFGTPTGQTITGVDPNKAYVLDPAAVANATHDTSGIQYQFFSA